MHKWFLVLITAFLASNMAYAEDMCASKAAEKKLAGAAKNSFMKKCEKDAKVEAATTDCGAKAAEKKLAGAAKNSFTKKCIADATK
jgi:hypothetical protein